LVGRSLVEFALRYCQVLIELAKPRQIAGGQLHPRRGMTAGPEEEIALLMRRWEQVKAGDGGVVLISQVFAIWRYPGAPLLSPLLRMRLPKTVS